MKGRVFQLSEKVQNFVSFRNKIFIFILVSMGLQLIFIGVNFRSALLDTLEHQVGTRALIQAQEIASLSELRFHVGQKDVPSIENMINPLAKISDASFIVIGDEQGVRLSHPVKERIGTPMKGNDNAGALERGKSYISVSEGSLGVSVRGKTPIFDTNGNIIGVVSVGYLLERFNSWLIAYAKPLLADFFVILFMTLAGGWLFSSMIKRRMNGMEPAEIAMALYLQKSILKSVYEGVIAIDKQGKVLTVNDAALELFGTDKPASELKNRSVTEIVNQTQFFFHTPFDENLKDELVVINNNTLIANRVAIYNKETLIGWVVSFRKKTEINSLTAELTQIEQYSENLSSMRRRYKKSLNTISEFLEVGNCDAALEFIIRDSYKKQELKDFITGRIQCKQVAAMLLGKFSRAKELKIKLRLVPKSHLYTLPEKLDEKELAAIIGSLIDNAFEATLNYPESNKIVSLLLLDESKELVIEIKDNGGGVEPEVATTMFTKGVSSKNEDDNNGVGLYLINRYVNSAGGVILVDEVIPKGTVFSIFIPNSAVDSKQTDMLEDI